MTDDTTDPTTDKAEKDKPKSRRVGQVIERDGMTDDDARDPADGKSQAQEDPMAEIAAALREIMKDRPPQRQVRRVGWGWWYQLQGEDPEPDEDDIWNDWFDRCIEEVFGNKRQQKIETGGAELR